MGKKIYAIETKTRYARRFRPEIHLDFVYEEQLHKSVECATYILDNQQIRSVDINIYPVFEATTQYKMAADKNNKPFSISIRRRFGKIKVTLSSHFKELEGN